jgi:hypothetical protein
MGNLIISFETLKLELKKIMNEYENVLDGYIVPFARN